MTNFLGEAHSSASVRARALKGVALSAVALAMVAPGYAQAQQAGEVQEVTITGSRIKAPNLTADSPVTAVGAEEIKQQGTTNIEQMLNNLPGITADLGNQGYGFGGAANVDLRGLGSSRTLVLVDGQRLGPTGPTNPAADLNTIPAIMIKSVEVLTGGASAVYGSDAMAGVVNFHLLNNFEGVMVDETFSGYLHDNNNATMDHYLTNGVGGVDGATGPTVGFRKGQQWDGFIRDTSFVMGSNAANNKGNITMWGEYRSTTPVVGPQRDTSACALSTTSSAPGRVCGGSSTGPTGKFTPLKSVEVAAGVAGANQGKKLTANPNGSSTFLIETGQQYFNFAQTAFEQAQDDRTSLGATGHYNVASWADVYGSMIFMHDANLSQIGPDPISTSPGATPPYLTVTIPCSELGNTPSPDPKLKGLTQQQLLGCMGPTGTGPLQTTTTTTAPGLRYQVSNPRGNEQDTYRYRAVLGVKGDINEAWSYDASAIYVRTDLTNRFINYPITNKITAALQSGALNPYTYDPAGQAAAEQGTNANVLRSGNTTDYDVVLTASGDLGAYGVQSPLARNPAMIVLGGEYRRAEVSNTPDYLISSGNLPGGPTPVPPFTGAEANREIFSEFRAPLVEDKPFVTSLDLNLSFRHTDTTVQNAGDGFSANTYKIAADYAPDNQLRFRGGFNKADRAPSAFELFNPFTPFGGLGGGSDPCAVGGTASMAACTNPALPAGARVPASAYSGGVTTLTNCTVGQCNLNTGGNIALKPEQAETWTWGVNLTPDFIPGFNASIDYWDIKIDHYINSIPANSILTGCYAGNMAFCQFIHRDPTGSLDNVTTGSIDDALRNIDSLHNTGLDFDIGYHRNLDQLGLGSGFGAISLNLVGTYALSAKVQVDDSLPTSECAGYYGANCGVPQPKWRHTFRATWNAPWGQDVTFAWRYIGGVSLDSNNPTDLTYTGVIDPINATIPSYSYFDLTTSYVLWDKYTFRVGVNNLMDKDPPTLSVPNPKSLIAALPGATINAFSTYDTLGRQIFMNFNAKF